MNMELCWIRGHVVGLFETSPFLCTLQIDGGSLNCTFWKHRSATRALWFLFEQLFSHLFANLCWTDISEFPAKAEVDLKTKLLVCEIGSRLIVRLGLILLHVFSRPEILKQEIKVFFVKYNDPIYVKLEKLDIMIRLASQANIAQVSSSRCF